MRITRLLSLLLIQISLDICASVDIIPPKIDPDVPPETDPSVGGEGEGSGGSSVYGGPSLGGSSSGLYGPSSTESDDVEDIGDALSSVIDAITSLLSDLSPSSSADISGISLPTATVDHSTITSAITIPTAALACFNASSVYSSCSAQGTGFISAGESVQANCLCYQTLGSSTSLLPFMSDCYQYVQTASNNSTAISAISEGAALCSSAQYSRTAIPPTYTSSPPTEVSSMANQQWEVGSSFVVFVVFLSYWAVI